MPIDSNMNGRQGKETLESKTAHSKMSDKDKNPEQTNKQTKLTLAVGDSCLQYRHQVPTNKQEEHPRCWPMRFICRVYLDKATGL